MTRIHALTAALIMSAGMVFAQEDISELYYVQMEEIGIPRSLINKVVREKGAQASLVESKMYVEVFRNGTLCWRSPALAMNDAGQREKFVFDQKDRQTSFAMMWKNGDEVALTVNVAESKALVRASTAGAGGVAGLLAGAGIGAVGAGVCTGGLGAPAGAIIGGVIGLVGGVGVAQFVPVKGAREITSFKCGKDAFGLDGQLTRDISTPDDITLTGSAAIKMRGFKRTDVVHEGGLKLQQKYLIRIRSLNLAGAQKKLKAGAKYYMELKIEGEDKPLVIELGQVPADTVMPREDFFVLKNIGGVSSIRIRRHRAMSVDPTVFEARQGATNGTSWVMIGKVQDDLGSFVEFQTYPTE